MITLKEAADIILGYVCMYVCIYVGLHVYRLNLPATVFFFGFASLPYPPHAKEKII